MRKNIFLRIACILVALVNVASAMQKVVVIEEFTSTT